MKRIVLFFVLIFALTIGTYHAKNSIPMENSYSTEKQISNETAFRVLKLASEETSYSYENLAEMHSVGQVAISEMSDHNMYKVVIQEADGGTVEVIIFDNL